MQSAISIMSAFIFSTSSPLYGKGIILNIVNKIIKFIRRKMRLPKNPVNKTDIISDRFNWSNLRSFLKKILHAAQLR